jgi:hypothetical protein
LLDLKVMYHRVMALEEQQQAGGLPN